MFSTPGSLLKRTGKRDADRPTFLKQLIEEYEDENTSQEHREQVLANLGNFAYDPINYEYFRRLNVVDLFLNVQNDFLNEGNSTAKATPSLNSLSFSIAGLCNLCLCEKNKHYLLSKNVVQSNLKSLSKLIVIYRNCEEREDKEEAAIVEIILNILTMLVFLFDSTSSQQILDYSDRNIHFMRLLSELSASSNKRVSNLAAVFLDDCVRPALENLEATQNPQS